MERFREAAKRACVKLTYQRLEIFCEVAASLEHSSAEAILSALRPQIPTISLDTVYRTLWLLYDLGLVSTQGPRRERVRFDANLLHHHHCFCVRCRLARDFEREKLNALHIPESVKELDSIAGTHVEVRGICGRCAQERPGNRRIMTPRSREAGRGVGHEQE